MIAMSGQREIELNAHRRARPGAQKTDRVARAARGGLAVERPGDRLEERGLARPVRADDTGEAKVELHPRVRVLTEVHEVERVESHSLSAIVMVDASTCSA